jgi:uncharacterized membrane protein
MGLHKLRAFWNRVRDSLWFVPALLTLGSAALAFLTIQLDVIGVLPDSPAGLILFSGTASGARGVLTAIASGFITVTGVVFSVTIVALQLASTQFTPRILRNFTADRVNQVVLGAFIATFTYALLVLRVVRGETGGMTPADVEAGARAATESVDTFVPHLSVTVAVGLAVVGIGFLIFFIHHAAQSVQAGVIIQRVTEDALSTVDRLLPERVGEPEEDRVDAATPDAEGSIVTAHRSGYVQGVDEGSLMALVKADGFTIRMEPEIGDFVLEGGTLATLWPAGLEADEAVVDAVRDAFVFGHARTPHADAELGVIELADIAVRALSPGINDPTTAVLCVDRLCEVLLAYARRERPRRVRGLPGGGTLILPLTPFSDLVDTAFDEIRHYGVENPRFAISFLDRLGELGNVLPHDSRPPVARHAAALLRVARTVVRSDTDLHRVEVAARRALQRLGVAADS